MASAHITHRQLRSRTLRDELSEDALIRSEQELDLYQPGSCQISAGRSSGTGIGGSVTISGGSNSPHLHPPGPRELISTSYFVPDWNSFTFRLGDQRLRATVWPCGIEFRVEDLVRVAPRIGLPSFDASTTAEEPIIRHVYWLEQSDLAQLEREMLFGLRRGYIVPELAGRFLFLIFYNHYVRDFDENSWVRVYLPRAWERWKTQAERASILDRMAEANNDDLPF